MGDKDMLGFTNEGAEADDNGTDSKLTTLEPASGSDDTILCGPCLENENKKVEAEIFCLECKEHLCVVCRKDHGKFKITRSHHLIDPARRDKKITESCQEHPGKDIDHFCEDHRSLCCIDCIRVSHASCKNIKDIEDEAKDVKESKELVQAKDNLVNLIKSFEKLKDFKANQKAKNKAQKVLCLNRIKELRKSAAEFFDRLEANAEREVEEESDLIIRETYSEEDAFKSAIEILETTSKNLDKITNSASEAQLFITLKRTLDQVNKYNNFLADTEKTLSDIQIVFRDDERFKQVFSVVSAIGKVVVQSELTRSARQHHRKESVSFELRKGVPAGGHAVRILGDRTTCYITAAAFLDDGSVILVDHNNKCIKVFDAQFQLIGFQIVTSRPNDLAVINQSVIVVTLTDEHILQFLCMEPDIRLDRDIKTEVAYFGVASSKEPFLFVSCIFKDGPGNVHVIDMDGTVKYQLSSTRSDSSLFMRPTSLLFNKEDSFLYVNDLGQNAVICVDISSPSNTRIVFVYKDRTLELRNGLARDETGRIYVASGNMTIHQVTQTGKKVGEILTAKHGIGMPQCLSFSSKNNKLLLAEFKENCVKVFKLI